MFSGIIRHIGTISEMHRSADAVVLTLASTLFGNSANQNLRVGDSVSVNGICLTIVSLRDGFATFDIATETLRRTTLGLLNSGDKVNLERSLRLGDSVDGHFVFGHVDAVSQVLRRDVQGNTVHFVLGLPGGIRSLIAPKGSVALDGVSLTVGEVSETTFSVYVIPHSLATTTLQDWQVGSSVNVEADMVARYVQRSLAVDRNVVGNAKGEGQ